jgi:serine/threonine protein kinase
MHYEDYNSRSFDEDGDKENNYVLHRSYGLIPMNTKSVFSERCQSQEDEKENYPCLLYLENGRYKNSFEEICFLGKGGFGICHKVRHRLDSNFYAIKKIRMHLAYDQDIKEHKVYREIMALPMLNHKNVVRYFGCWAERIDW